MNGPVCAENASANGGSTCSIYYTASTTPEIYTLSLHDALPISCWPMRSRRWKAVSNRRLISWLRVKVTTGVRSEEHTSELQSRPHLVCRLLLEKKNRECGDTPRRSRRDCALRQRT